MPVVTQAAKGMTRVRARIQIRNMSPKLKLSTTVLYGSPI